MIELLNSWFDSLDSLDVDSRIAAIKAGPQTPDPDEASIKLVTELRDVNSPQVLKDLLDRHEPALNELGVLELVREKISVLESQHLLELESKLCDEINALQISPQDEFSRQFFFETETIALVKLCSRAVTLEKPDKSALGDALMKKVNALRAVILDDLLKKTAQDVPSWVEEKDVDGTAVADAVLCAKHLNMVQNVHIAASRMRKKSSNAISTVLGVQEPTEPVWAVEELLRPVVTRFVYHFCGKNATNKLNEPELATEYFANYATDDRFLMAFSRYFEGIFTFECPFSLEKVTLIDSNRHSPLEVIRVFHKFLKMKFQNDLKAHYTAYFLPRLRLFSNLIFQLSQYDEKIKNKFFIVDDSLVVDLLLVNNNWKSWIDLESENVIKTFNDKFPASLGMGKVGPDSEAQEETVMNEDIFTVDFSVVKMAYLKPTKISLSFLNLVKNVIDFDVLALQIPAGLKIKLLESMVLKIIDLYTEKFEGLLSRLKVVNSGGNKYLNALLSESLSSFKGGDRKKKKVSQEDGILNEVKILTKMYCSIKYIVIKLESYNLHLEFIKIQRYLEEHRDDDSFKQAVLLLLIDESQLQSMCGGPVFGNKILRLEAIVDKIIDTLNNFLKKSLKVYLGNYFNLQHHWDQKKDPESLFFVDRIQTIEEYINYGFVKLNKELTAYEPTKELLNPINLLIEQLGFVKRCLGLSYSNTAADYKSVETHVLSHLRYFFYSYIIKINKFSFHGAAQLKYDYLCVVSKILRLDASGTGFDYNQFIGVKQQEYLVKILDCCHVLMVNSQNIEKYGEKDLSRLRDRQKFDKLRTSLSLRLVSDNEVYDLVSRVIFS